MSPDDLQALWLTLKLAVTTTLVLLILGIPLAWWIFKLPPAFKAIGNAVIALPLVLPPSVLGFYLLLAFAPNGPIGLLGNTIGVGQLAFSFHGLVIASVIYSLPFVVQPLINSYESLGQATLEAAASLNAGPLDTFANVVLPQIKPGLLTAGVLGFAHTVGEFGIVLMIGGNIPGVTKVASVQIYDHVESLNYGQAHTLSAVLLVFSFLVLFALYTLSSNAKLFSFRRND